MPLRTSRLRFGTISTERLCVHVRSVCMWTQVTDSEWVQGTFRIVREKRTRNLGWNRRQSVTIFRVIANAGTPNVHTLGEFSTLEKAKASCS